MSPTPIDNQSDLLATFIDAACVPLDSGHASGTLERAQAILAEHPHVATSNIHTAAILGDDAAVRRFLAIDKKYAMARGGPRAWDALTHLCFSRYLRLDLARSAGFVRAAEALLDAGASANTGWFEKTHQPKPEWESVLYGAAGVAHHPELTRLLLKHGADPNDGETSYHAPETRDNAVLKVLVESGKVSADGLAIMLLRKADWHDGEGIAYLLEQGAEPNRMTQWYVTALHQAIRRDNDVKHIEAMLDHGGNPTLKSTGEGKTAIAIAARRGRGDVLALFQRRGIAIELQGVERLLAACARNDAPSIRAITADSPQLISDVLADGGRFLAEFAGNGNTDGVRHLIDLGVNVAVLYREGDGYFGIAKDSTALHVAAWRARHATVKLLIEREAPLDALDGNGRSPLALAIRACVNSYWAQWRSPESVEALLRAGASVTGVDYPSGYDAVDALLARHAKTA